MLIILNQSQFVRAQEKKIIKPGIRIRITVPMSEKFEYFNRISHTGTLTSYDSTTFLLNTDSNKTLTIQFNSIKRFELSTGESSHKTRTTIIGFITGTLIGGVIITGISSGSAGDFAWTGNMAPSLIYGAILGGIPGAHIASKIVNMEHWKIIPLAKVEIDIKSFLIKF